ECARSVKNSFGSADGCGSKHVAGFKSYESADRILSGFSLACHIYLAHYRAGAFRHIVDQPDPVGSYVNDIILGRRFEESLISVKALNALHAVARIRGRESVAVFDLYFMAQIR